VTPDNSDQERRITTDPNQIETWGRETKTVPVREGEEHRLVDEGKFDEDRHERVDWDDFGKTMTDSDRVVVYHEDRGQLEYQSRDEAMTHIEGEDVEERLLSGEVVTGTITETATVERTIVEEFDIESEIVGSEIVSRDVVDVELLTRECTSCSMDTTMEEDYEARYDDAYFFEESDEQFDFGDSYEQLTDVEELDFDLVVDETWSLTIEELEEYIVESRVTDIDTAESDTVEDVDIRSDVDTATVHRHLLESDIFETNFSDIDNVDTEVHAIESETHEGDAIQTTIAQERTIEREVELSHEMTATGRNSERTSARTTHDELVSSRVAERAGMGGGTAAGAASGTEATDSHTDTETTTDTTTDDATADTPMTDDTGSTPGTEPTDGATASARVEPTEEDEGKTVVDTEGTELGIVSHVEGGRLYVDPDPSLTDRLASALGWGDSDEDDYVLSPNEIALIEKDRVEVYTPEQS
jgi:hypothetical protein